MKNRKRIHHIGKWRTRYRDCVTWCACFTWCDLVTLCECVTWLNLWKWFQLCSYSIWNNEKLDLLSQTICCSHLHFSPSDAASYHLAKPITADFPDSEKARAVSCPISWTPTFYQTCLKYMDQSKTYDDAKDSCENLNAELVTFSNKLHILFFKGFLADIG